MSKILLVAMLLSGILFIPKLVMLHGTIASELAKFDTFKLSGNVTQTAPVMIPNNNPWVVIDLNSNLTLTKEIFVIDKDSVKYRLFGIQKIPREDFKEPSAHRPQVSAFLASVLLMMLPGIALLFYIRTWLKYFFIILIMGTFFFVVMELSKLRLRWVQMLNIAAHALTLVILVEVISAPITTTYLVPIMRFLGVSIYAVTTVLGAVLMVVGIVGYHIEEHLRNR